MVRVAKVTQGSLEGERSEISSEFPLHEFPYYVNNVTCCSQNTARQH